MKKLLFPLLILLVAIFATSCIKNSESDGVKAVRMGQAALLQARATAETTEATANAAVATANAALINAQAAVQTAQAAVVQAEAAAQLLDNAAQTERNRHIAAEHALQEQVDAAQTTLEKQQLADALAQETANSAKILQQIAIDKAQLDATAAQNVITNQEALIVAQQNLADAQTAAAEAAAQRVLQDAIFMAQLKADNLGNLADEYAAAVAAYNAEQANIDLMNDNIITAGQTLVALNNGINIDSAFVGSSVKILRANVANAQADVTSKTGKVTTATNDLNTAKTALAADKAILAGQPIEVIEKTVKDSLNVEITRYATINAQLIVQETIIQDVDFVAARNKADAAVAAAQPAFDAAVLAANGASKTDSINAEFYFKANIVPNLAAAIAAGWQDPVTLLTCWDYTIAGVHSAYVPFASAVQFQNLNPVDPADDAARAAAHVLLTLMQAKYDAILATQATNRATVVTTLATLNAAKAVAAPLDAKFTTLSNLIADLTARLASSNARKTALQALISWIDTNKLLDTIWAAANAQIATDNATVAAKQTALDTANANLTTSKNNLAAAQTALTNGIAAYIQNKPFDLQDVAYLTLQIADLNTQLAAEKIILAQDLAVVNMWLAKIQTALQ